MPNNADIPATGEVQYIANTGPRDRGQLTGYEGVLERKERDKKMQRRVEDGREPLEAKKSP